MSRHIAMSEPSRAWISATLSGVRRSGRAVVDRAERDAVVVDPHERVAEREDLEAAGVGEDRPVPAGERVQSTELLDHVLARAEMEVVRVAEDHVGAERAHLGGSERLDGGLRADRHERGRPDLAVRGADHAGAGGAVGRLEREAGHRASVTGSASRRRRSRSGTARGSRARRARGSASTPANAITSASSVVRGRWKFVSSASTRRNAKPGVMKSSVRPLERRRRARSSRARASSSSRPRATRSAASIRAHAAGSTR